MAYALQDITMRSTSPCIEEYLRHLPAPAYVCTDGGGEFETLFTQTLAHYNIKHRTNIPKRSQVQGTVEASVKLFKNLLTRLCGVHSGGRNEWSRILPLLLQNFNCTPPYNVPLSRRQLFLSPFITTKYGILISPGDLFPANIIRLQQASHQALNNKRIQALHKLRSKLGGPIFELKEGLIVTEDDRVQETKDGSRALLPTKTTLYKVLKVLSGGSAARVKNLTNGDESTKSINKLGRLQLNNLYDLHLDPLLAFSEDDTLRTSNIYRQLQGQFDFLESEKVPLTPDPGRLRNGRNYNAQISALMKTCLKQRKPIKLYTSDLDNMGPSQRQAAMRGMQLAVELGYPLSPLERTLLARKFHQNTLHHYNVPNTAKPRTKTKVHFQDTVLSTKVDKHTSPSTVSGMEMILMGIYYSVSLVELQHHLVMK